MDFEHSSGIRHVFVARRGVGVKVRRCRETLRALFVRSSLCVVYRGSDVLVSSVMSCCGRFVGTSCLLVFSFVGFVDCVVLSLRSLCS